MAEKEGSMDDKPTVNNELIRTLNDRTEQNCLATLDEAAEFVKKNKVKNLVVVTLIDEDPNDGSKIYRMSFFNAGMFVSEMITLFDVAKSKCKRLMGY